MLKRSMFRWPGEDALLRLQVLGRPGGQDEVVIAALRAAQAVLVEGEEKGRESCLEWMQQCAREGEGEVSLSCFLLFIIPFKQVSLVARDVAAVVRLVTRQLSPEVEEAVEGDNGEERDWTLSFLDTLVLDSLAGGQIPYKPRNTKADSIEGSSVSLQPASQRVGGISVGLSESISMDLSSLKSSDMFSSSRGEPSALWTLEGRLEVSSSTLEMSPQTPSLPEAQKSSGGLDGLLEEGWS